MAFVFCIPSACWWSTKARLSQSTDIRLSRLRKGAQPSIILPEYLLNIIKLQSPKILQSSQLRAVLYELKDQGLFSRYVIGCSLARHKQPCGRLALRRDDIESQLNNSMRRRCPQQKHEQCSTSVALCKRLNRSLIPRKPWISLHPTATLRNPLYSAISSDCPTPKHHYKRSQLSSQSRRRSPILQMLHRARKIETEIEDITMPESCIWANPTSVSRRNPPASSKLPAQARLRDLRDKLMGQVLAGMDSRFLFVLSDV